MPAVCNREAGVFRYYCIDKTFHWSNPNVSPHLIVYSIYVSMLTVWFHVAGSGGGRCIGTAPQHAFRHPWGPVPSLYKVHSHQVSLKCGQLPCSCTCVEGQSVSKSSCNSSMLLCETLSLQVRGLFTVLLCLVGS